MGLGMDITTTMLDRSLIQLMWLASPALPVGGFSYSEGLESAVDAGLAAQEADAKAWLQDQLAITMAPADFAVVALALNAWAQADYAAVLRLNNWVLQTRETAELQAQTQQMGRSMLDWLANHDIAPDTSANTSANNTYDATHDIAQLRAMGPTYPVAFALAASRTQAPLRSCVLAYAFGWAENMVQAAIKSVPLGQRSGQRILAALAHDIPAAVDHALHLREEGLQSYSPMLAILSSHHESQYSRLFRS